MSKGQLVERIRNIFQGRAQSHEIQVHPVVQSTEKERLSAPDTDTVAAIATALNLSGRTESAANFGSDIAAAIAAALHLHLTRADTASGSEKKIHEPSPWSQYGREQIQNARFRIFNRPVSYEKNVPIRQR
jgi:ribulose kinase